MDNFNKSTIITICLLTFTVLALGIFAELESLKVRNIELSGTPTAADFINQSLEFDFNRPIATTQEDKFSISPQVEYDLYIINGKLTVTLANIDPQTEYSVRIAADFADSYGRQLGSEFSYSFTTKQRSFLYVQKANQGSDNTDQLKLAYGNLNDVRAVFEKPGIDLFAAGKEFIALTRRLENGSSELFVVDSKSLAVEEINIGLSRISSLDYSPTQEQFVYTLQPVELISGIISPTAAHTIKIYDIATRSTEQVNLPFKNSDVVSVEYTPDGAALLLKLVEGEYYMISLEETSQYVELGTHIDSNGFNYQGDKVLFTDIPLEGAYSGYPIFSITDATRDSKIIANSETSITDPAFLYSQDKIVYSEQAERVEGARGRFRLVLHDLNTDRKEILLDDQNFSLELPRVSFDDRYILVEKYSIASLTNYEDMRSFGYQTKPYTAQLVLYDLEKREIISETEGVNALWLR